jgi:hypothetical protein
MAERESSLNDQDPIKYLNSFANEEKRNDSFAIMELMQAATGSEPKMWGDSIIGFGSYHYKYASGREGEWFLVGFIPRKQKITLYIMSGFDDYEVLLEKLGKYRRAKSCIHIRKLADVDKEILQEIVKRSAKHMLDTH